MRYAVRRTAAGGALAALALLLGGTACTTGSPPPTAEGSASARPGGTLRLLYDQRVAAWDPQRLAAAGPESAVALRTFARTLTGYRPGSADAATALTGDLATDTGRSDDGGRTWVFTLRTGPAWEDGRPVTCADVKYGISRAFARTRLTGGTPYAAVLLDIPGVTDSRGMTQPSYQGPYTDMGAAAFDAAVACAGETLTIRLAAPEPEFPAIVALAGFAAYRADRDRGADGALDVFSCGPYRLEAPWEPGSGGRLVRNPAWRAEADPLRRALPEVIEIREGLPVETIATRLAEDKHPDDGALSLADLPVTVHTRLLSDGAAAARVSRPPSGTVELLAPNLKSSVMAVPAVRAAFATATDRAAFAAAYGPGVLTPTSAVLPSRVPGGPPPAGSTTPASTATTTGPSGSTAAGPSAPAPATPTAPTATGTTTAPSAGPDSSQSGDPVAARAALVAAGVGLPVPVRLAYRSSVLADAAFAALRTRWAEAGFEVTLEPIGGDYFATISAPAAATRYDVFRTAWFPDYPSGGAVLPELFDSRLNLSPTGTGADVGSFSDPALEALMDAAHALTEPAARAQAWRALDQALAAAGAHIALAERHRFFARGSAVTAYLESLPLGGWPDLAVVGVRS